MDSLIILAPLAFLLSMFLIYRFRSPACRLGLVDVPGGRKAHNGHMPVIGGAGMFVAFLLVLLLVDGSLYPYRGLLAGMGLLLVTGILDDLHDLAVREKIAVQAVAGVLLVGWGDLLIRDLGVVPGVGAIELGVMALPFTLLCVVGLINAVNMVDGADGLCGSVMVAVFFWLAVIGGTAADRVAMMLPALLACVLAGFLVFNFPWRSGRCASVFMGDSGSTMLGFAAAWCAIDLTFEQGTGVAPVTVAWILALPVFDTMTLMLRRMLKGRSPLRSDREHLHHVFERAGFSAKATAYALTGMAFLFGGIGVGAWFWGVPEAWMWPPLLLVLLVHFVFVQRAWRTMRWLRRVRRLRAPAPEKAIH